MMSGTAPLPDGTVVVVVGAVVVGALVVVVTTVAGRSAVRLPSEYSWGSDATAVFFPESPAFGCTAASTEPDRRTAAASPSSPIPAGGDHVVTPDEPR